MAMTRAESKFYLLDTCERMPEKGQYFKIPWDAYKNVWIVCGLDSEAVVLAVGYSDGRREIFKVPDATWIEHIRSGLIWSSSRNEV
jgi:hypothetical protein